MWLTYFYFCVSFFWCQPSKWSGLQTVEQCFVPDTCDIRQLAFEEFILWKDVQNRLIQQYKMFWSSIYFFASLFCSLVPTRIQNRASLSCIKVWDSVQVKIADFLPSASCQDVLLSVSIKEQITIWIRALWRLVLAHVTWTLDIICAIFIKGVSRCYLKAKIVEIYDWAFFLVF